MTFAIAETPRLVLDTWREEDVAPLAQLGTPEVVRYLGGEPWTEASSIAFIELWRDIEARLEITTWAVRLRETGELIGTCGFAGTNRPWVRVDVVIEIGWTLGRRWWGQGLATEAGRAALGVGLTHYPASRFISKCSVDNIASERVMQRLAMERVGVVQDTWPRPTVVYRLPAVGAELGHATASSATSAAAVASL